MKKEEEQRWHWQGRWSTIALSRGWDWKYVYAEGVVQGAGACKDSLACKENAIGEEGAVALARALERNNSITMLNLGVR